MSLRSPLMRSTSARMRLATSTVLAPLCFWMPTVIEGNAVHLGQVAHVLEAVDHLGHVAHAHRAPVDGS